MKINTIQLGFLLASMLNAGAAAAQDLNAAKVKELVESKNFVFHAQFANPQGGRSIALTSTYDLTVRPESVESFLPFFGRAYTAPINPSESGIKFNSTNFAYNGKKGKKKWNIEINPKDVSDVQALNLSVFDNGKASLVVTSNNRQSINYNGYITPGGEVKKKAF
jgi:hypothetical protein